LSPSIFLDVGRRQIVDGVEHVPVHGGRQAGAPHHALVAGEADVLRIPQSLSEALVVVDVRALHLALVDLHEIVVGRAIALPRQVIQQLKIGGLAGNVRGTRSRVRSPGRARPASGVRRAACLLDANFAPDRDLFLKDEP
jgi:hypothetical protein